MSGYPDSLGHALRLYTAEAEILRLEWRGSAFSHFVFQDAIFWALPGYAYTKPGLPKTVPKADLT